MLSTFYVLVLTSALHITTTTAQCRTPGYIPCLPKGSQLGGVAPSDFGNSGFWDSLQGIASAPIGRKAKRNAIVQSPPERRAPLPDRLKARQNALCCAPDPDKECLLLTDANIPFCYDTTTTRFVFSDESYGYINNGTYYAADGTIVNFQDGTESMTDGATTSFAPATSAASATATATVPGTGKVTSVAGNGGSGSGSSGSTSSAAAPGSSGMSGGSSGTSPSASSGSQPKSNEGVGPNLAGAAYALSALAVGFLVAFAGL